jgi:hypothetical protein
MVFRVGAGDIQERRSYLNARGGNSGPTLIEDRNGDGLADVVLDGHWAAYGRGQHQAPDGAHASAPQLLDEPITLPYDEDCGHIGREASRIGSRAIGNRLHCALDRYFQERLLGLAAAMTWPSSFSKSSPQPDWLNGDGGQLSATCAIHTAR